ncbi:MAG TPA: squalene/phytoene synthase family protein [Bacteroidales bacterium]|nr:squalene/phytoene synthase family protein [Bacteroidales bacterium]
MNDQTATYLNIFNAIDFEKIIDHPNILIAANFWDSDRYKAAKVCYKTMRYIDDLVDHYKTEHPVISEAEQKQLTIDVNNWLSLLKSGSQEAIPNQELLETFATFKIPIWPMEAFAKSMIYDISHDGFPSLQAFLDYAEGASVAPAAIFVHLCGLNGENGLYQVPSFDVQKAARACAVFSYLVHIIRDFQKDQFDHLNYFADDLLDKYGLTRLQLDEMAHGAPILTGFRDMIREYLVVADAYRLKTYDIIQEIKPHLHPRCQLSLDIIFNLYLMVFERIDATNSNFTAKELNPTADEVKERVYKTILDFKPC